MKVIELVFFDAGGGHRSAANALCEVVRREERPWEMRMMNLQDLLDEMDIFRKLTGIRMQDIYNLMLQRGWTLGSPQLVPVMHGIIRTLHSKQVSLLADYWRDRKADLIVSVIPNFNRALFEAAARAMPRVPMVTILTDMADYPPHFWMERQEQYFICGTARAYAQAIAMGHAPERVFQTSGMILHPRFHEPLEMDKRGELERLGLDPDLPTALVMFGGEGSSKMLGIAERLHASGVRLQIIAICGKNQKLEAKLRDMPRRVPVHVEGFTKEVPRFMRMADFLIGKPGPGSVSEAVAMGLPVIVESNAWTLPQERFNATWVEEQGVGIRLKDVQRGIAEAARRMVDAGERAGFVARVRAMRNRAIFEIPDILEEIMGQRR